MSIAEILEELPKLANQERKMLFERLEQLEGNEIKETPEMLAANSSSEINVSRAGTRLPVEPLSHVKSAR